MSLNKLKLPADATPEQVKEIWRKMASELHPDHGGDAAEFSKWRQIYRDALAEAEAPKDCRACLGRKTVTVVNGWSSVEMVCSRCCGTGIENPEE